MHAFYILLDNSKFSQSIVYVLMKARHTLEAKERLTKGEGKEEKERLRVRYCEGGKDKSGSIINFKEHKLSHSLNGLEPNIASFETQLLYF